MRKYICGGTLVNKNMYISKLKGFSYCSVYQCKFHHENSCSTKAILRDRETGYCLFLFESEEDILLYKILSSFEIVKDFLDLKKERLEKIK